MERSAALPLLTYMTKNIPASKKELEGALMAIENANGATLKSLAAKYSLTPGAVKQRIDAVRESGLLDSYRYLLADALLPMAIAVYEARLARGDFDAARDILFGLGILSKGDQKGKKESAGAPVESETLEVFRRRRTYAAEAYDVEVREEPKVEIV